MKLMTRYSLLCLLMGCGRGSFCSPYTKMTMSDVLYRAIKYMNAEDVLLALEEKPKNRERQEDARQDRG